MRTQPRGDGHPGQHQGPGRAGQFQREDAHGGHRRRARVLRRHRRRRRVAVEIIGSDTTAYIGQGSVVNAAAGAGPDQAVYVTAYNDAEDTSLAGGLGGGIVGIGGAVDVGLVRNNTSAYISAGASVSATGNVDVNALSKKNVQSDVLSAAFGIAAAAGSVTVWTLGADFTSTYSDGTPVTDRGVWLPNTSYNQNDLVTGSNGVVYIAQANVPYGNDLDPTKDTTNTEWRPALWNGSTSYTKGQLVLGSTGTCSSRSRPAPASIRRPTRATLTGVRSHPTASTRVV